MTKGKKIKRKRFKTALIVTAAILAVIIVKLVSGREKNVTVDIDTPYVGMITERIPANGKIRPVTEIKISPDVSGEIIELNVEEGDRVSAGDLILKIKQDVYLSLRERAVASLNATKAQYQQQQARLRQAEQNYLRNRRLYESRAISQQEYETSTAEYNMAKEELNAAEFNIQSALASLNEAEENLTKTTIYAPIDGIISLLSVEKGERVVGTSQMAGTEMMRIADFGRMEVVVDVNENDIIRVALGDTADINVDAYPERIFKGIVTRIANLAKNLSSTSSNEVTNFEVTIGILEESYADLLSIHTIPFRPGMSASAEITTERKSNTLTVPLQAVTADECIFVFDSESGKVKKVKIKTGIQDISRIEILEGIGPDAMIITGPYSVITGSLDDGLEVNPNYITKDKE